MSSPQEKSTTAPEPEQQQAHPRFKGSKKHPMPQDTPDPTAHPSVKGGLRDPHGFRVKRQATQARSTAPDYQAGQGPPQNAQGMVTIEEETVQGAKYVIEGPLRRVPAYYFTYLTFCKMRWRDRNLLDVFTTEFRDRDREYYKYAISEGLVSLNKKVATLDTIIRNGDQISHRTHKHEPPVTSRPIKIVYEDDELVVIDKPSGIPVHPTGRYRFNTVVMVMQHEMGKVVHRKYHFMH